jgi:hypothetical protein
MTRGGLAELTYVSEAVIATIIRSNFFETSVNFSRLPRIIPEDSHVIVVEYLVIW